ncbi:MAG TPA: hypothetical protein VGH64_07435, partial [Puia sp.]
MRTINLLPLILIIGFCACHNGEKNEKTDSSNSVTSADTTMKMIDSSKMIPPLPPVPADAKVYFKNLMNGEIVHSPVKVEMGLKGLKLDTAGAVVPGTG